MIELSVNTEEMKRVVDRLAKESGLNFGDFRPLFLEFDGWLSRHLKDNFNREGPHWSPLAPATVRARLKGWGYYKKRSTEGDRHRIGRWTHGAYKRAQKKGKALRSKYIRDFGPEDFSRAKLEWLHLGGPSRPPRRLYKQRTLDKKLRILAERFARSVVNTIEEKLADLGPGISERLTSRFL